MGVGHLVSVCGHLELLKRLYVKDPDLIRQTTELGSSLLAAAALGGHLGVIRFLVEDCNLDVTIPDDSGGTPIVWAHQQNHHTVVAYLQSHGATLDVSMEDGWNKLTEAARSGDVDVVRTLLDQGGEADDVTRLGITPLMVACQNGYRSVAELLLHRGAAPNHQAQNGASARFGRVFRERSNYL